MEISTLFLGAIALATIMMAMLQIVVIVYGARLVRKLNRVVDQVEREIQPTLDRVNRVSADAARATSLAVAQVERADQLFAQAAEHTDHLMVAAQQAVVEPIRQGVSLLQGLRAAFAALRGVWDPPAPPADSVSEDDKELFIG